MTISKRLRNSNTFKDALRNFKNGAINESMVAMTIDTLLNEADLIPKGRYVAQVRDFRRPRPKNLNTDNNEWYMTIVLDIVDTGKQLVAHVGGDPIALGMLFSSKPFWIGKAVDVKVTVIEHDDAVRNSCSIYWNFDDDTTVSGR